LGEPRQFQNVNLARRGIGVGVTMDVDDAVELGKDKLDAKKRIRRVRIEL